MLKQHWPGMDRQSRRCTAVRQVEWQRVPGEYKQTPKLLLQLFDRASNAGRVRLRKQVPGYVFQMYSRRSGRQRAGAIWSPRYSNALRSRGEDRTCAVGVDVEGWRSCMRGAAGLSSACSGTAVVREGKEAGGEKRKKKEEKFDRASSRQEGAITVVPGTGSRTST